MNSFYGVLCRFPIGILDQVWYLIASIPDLYTLTYFHQDDITTSQVESGEGDCLAHKT